MRGERLELRRHLQELELDRGIAHVARTPHEPRRLLSVELRRAVRRHARLERYWGPSLDRGLGQVCDQEPKSMTKMGRRPGGAPRAGPLEREKSRHQIDGPPGGRTGSRSSLRIAQWRMEQ